MIYTTRIFGAPYGMDGERGNYTNDPEKMARETLHPGQRLDVFAHPDGIETLARRFTCSLEHGVTEVNL